MRDVAIRSGVVEALEVAPDQPQQHAVARILGLRVQLQAPIGEILHRVDPAAPTPVGAGELLGERRSQQAPYAPARKAGMLP